MSGERQLKVTFIGDAGSLQKAFGDIDNASDGVGAKFGSMAKAGLAAFAMVGTAAAGAVGFGLKIAAENEQATISFTTMLGSAEKAGSFLKDLQKFAASTPFEFPELQTAASSLISAGFEASKVIPIMTTLGNVTSGMGTGSEGVQRATVALQQMSAAGRITGEDLNQLRDAGIPVFDLLAGATGKSKEEIAKLAQAGKLGKEEMQLMFDALATGGAGLERFDGLMEKQSQSLTGMVSTLKDTVGQALASIATPIVSGLKDALPELTDTLNDVFEEVGPVFADAISSLLGVVAELLPAVAPVLKVLGGALSTALQSLGPVIAKAAPDLAKLAEAFGDLLAAVLPLLPQLLSLTVQLLPPLTTLAAALASMIEAIPPGVLLAVVAAFILMSSEVVAVAAILAGLVVGVQFLGQHIGVLGDIVATVGAAISTAFGAIQNAVAGVINWVRGNWPLLLAILTGPIGIAVLTITRNFDSIVSFVSGLPGRIAGAAKGMWDGLTAAAKAAFNAIARLWNGTVGKLTFKVPGWVPGLGGKGFDVPNIPYLAAGGNVTGSGAAVVGEFGPELLDLPRGATVTPLTRANSDSNSGTSPTTIILQIDGREFARATVKPMHSELLRLGVGNAGLGFS